ncbi:MAG: alpha/beta hydrolase [Planctomycetota bacterium]
MEAVEQIVRKPPEKQRKTPLFLQHDLFHDVRVWEGFTEHLLALGWTVRAISLPGHGQSSCHKGELNFYNLEDYINPFARRLSRINPRPVVVAHGVGAPMLMKILEQRDEKSLEVGDMPAAALIAPMPMTGVGGMLARLKKRHRVNTLMGFMKRAPYHWVRTPKLARELLVGPQNTLTDAELHHLVVPESIAIFEQLKEGIPLRERVREMPLRIFAGDADACFALDATREYAEALGAEVELFEGMGHDLMLEPCAEELARRLDRWLVEDLGIE